MNLEKMNARSAAVVTPNDSTDLPRLPALALYIGAAGNVKVITANNETITFNGLAAGSYLNVQVKRVFATDTTVTAGNVIALYP